MSEQQIQTILKKLEEQDKTFKESQDAYFRAIGDVRKDIRTIQVQMNAIEAKQEPMYQIFESVSGFNQIAIWILKGLIMIGAGIGVIYGAIKYLRGDI